MEQVKGPVVLVQREASFHLGMTNEKMEGALVDWFSRRLEALKVDSDGEELNGSDIPFLTSNTVSTQVGRKCGDFFWPTWVSYSNSKSNKSDFAC